MTDFTQQLSDYEGELIFQKEKSTIEVERTVKNKETGLKEKKMVKEPKITEYKMTLQRCAKFALLDLANCNEGMESELNSAESMHKRYTLMKRIDTNPKEVELSKEDKDLITSLLPYHYEVVIVGQIMDLL